MNETINQHLNILRALQSESGLFLASSQEVPTGYNKAWLRDNFYTSLAFEAIGDWETVKKLWWAILDILLKHEEKISYAVQNKPHESWQYIHARYNPKTFDEYWEEWGNKQNDVVGEIMFKVGELEKKSLGIVRNKNDKRILQKLVDYVNSIEYWHDPDSGIWEEGEEVHASSIGAVLAGLKNLSTFPYINIHQDLIKKGELALKKLLPRESQNHFCNLAQLSLIYPYNIIEQSMADEILKNLEYQFIRKNGVIRYKNDHYYNKNKDGWSEEAEWTMGFPWLALVYHQRGEKEKAKIYLEKARATLDPEGKLPELYYSNSTKPNENIPLAWAESLFIVASLKIKG
jgi:GH15 family glucan-1,4-alpha-glucosidase